MTGVKRISGSGGSSPITPLGRSDAKSPSMANFPITFRESFAFPHKKLTIKEEHRGLSYDPQDNPFFESLLKLFLEILESGIEIVPTQPIDAGGYAVDAFFRPPENPKDRSSMHLPLPIKAVTKKPIFSPTASQLTPEFKKFVFTYVEKVITNFNNEQILKLIIVTSHEYGHYQSYVRGNHDEDLKRGLYLFQRKYTHLAKSDEFTWLVFREECQAWRYAEAFLKKTNFTDWDVYEEVKKGSLKTYFEHLNLKNASLDTYYKLSFLGEDFKNNSPSILSIK